MDPDPVSPTVIFIPEMEISDSMDWGEWIKRQPFSLNERGIRIRKENLKFSSDKLFIYNSFQDNPNAHGLNLKTSERMRAKLNGTLDQFKKEIESEDYPQLMKGIGAKFTDLANQRYANIQKGFALKEACQVLFQYMKKTCLEMHERYSKWSNKVKCQEKIRFEAIELEELKDKLKEIKVIHLNQSLFEVLPSHQIFSKAYAEKKNLELQKIRKNLSELKSELISVESEILNLQIPFIDDESVRKASLLVRDQYSNISDIPSSSMKPFCGQFFQKMNAIDRNLQLIEEEWLHLGKNLISVIKDTLNARNVLKTLHHSMKCDAKLLIEIQHLQLAKQFPDLWKYSLNEINRRFQFQGILEKNFGTIKNQIQQMNENENEARNAFMKHFEGNTLASTIFKVKLFPSLFSKCHLDIAFDGNEKLPIEYLENSKDDSPFIDIESDTVESDSDSLSVTSNSELLDLLNNREQKLQEKRETIEHLKKSLENSDSAHFEELQAALTESQNLKSQIHSIQEQYNFMKSSYADVTDTLHEKLTDNIKMKEQFNKQLQQQNEIFKKELETLKSQYLKRELDLKQEITLYQSVIKNMVQKLKETKETHASQVCHE